MDTDSDRQQEQEPSLCMKGCGFYGCRENLNMCSKCYREHKKQEEIEAVANLLMSKLDIKGSTDGSAVGAADAVLDVSKKPEEGTGQAAAAAVVPRCVRCNKKVSMYGFKCRCGSLCCSRHRYPEEHECGFDFKTAGRISLAKDNVLVKPDKLKDRII